MIEKISLANLKGGAAIELVDDAFATVLENIIDPNRPATATRKIALLLTISPNESREMFGLKMDVKLTLAAPAGHDATVFIAHTKNGVIALEHDPKQAGLFEEKEEENSTVEKFPTTRNGKEN